MPGNLLFADKTFPVVSGNNESDLKAILNYMYMLQEQLRYTLGNLGSENINPEDFNLTAENIDFADAEIVTHSIAVKTLAANVDSLHLNQIAMQAGFDFTNPDYMPFEDTTGYTPMSRTLLGVNSVQFYGDAKLSVTGGAAGNFPVPTGGILNRQTGTDTVIQSGIEMYSERNLTFTAQTGYGTDGFIDMFSRPITNVPLNGLLYQLRVSDTGITVYKYKNIGGTVTYQSSTTLFA